MLHMKSMHLFLVSILGAATAFSLQAAPQKSPNGSNDRAEVIFFEPEKFADASDSWQGDVVRAGYLDELKTHILTQSKSFVPAGYKLQVTFTEIDMAGEFETWRGPSADRVRIVKESYPPRIDLAFRITNAEGAVVQEGRRELRDNNFMMKLTLASRNDPLRHEKEMIDTWLRQELPRGETPKA
jgi:hypothetical protein